MIIIKLGIFQLRKYINRTLETNHTYFIKLHTLENCHKTFNKLDTKHQKNYIITMVLDILLPWYKVYVFDDYFYFCLFKHFKHNFVYILY